MSARISRSTLFLGSGQFKGQALCVECVEIICDAREPEPGQLASSRTVDAQHVHLYHEQLLKLQPEPSTLQAVIVGRVMYGSQCQSQWHKAVGADCLWRERLLDIPVGVQCGLYPRVERA